MTSPFPSDLTSATRDLDAARAEISAVLAALTDADLDHARRRGWSVRRVLKHLIQSEWLYARLVSHLRDLSVPGGQTPPDAPPTATDAIGRLQASRRTLLAALDGVNEDAFYRLRTLGHEEYSVLSVLENVASHDREHAAQIRAILRPPQNP